jgi:hypothetical protein
MAGTTGLDPATSCVTGRLTTSRKSCYFKHSIEDSSLRRQQVVCLGVRIWPSARRVTTKVTTVLGYRKGSRDVKPKIRVVPITQLVLDDKNANKGTKRGRELLEESLEKYGAGRSAVVDRNNRVLAGNKTVEAARAAGMKSIAVIETDGSSLVPVQRGDLGLRKDRKARELAIADNRVGELDLEWNPEVLASFDLDLRQFWNENEFNALRKDFRSNELSAPEPKLDQVGELQKKWKTKHGQIWEIGNHRLMFGDSASEIWCIYWPRTRSNPILETRASQQQRDPRDSSRNGRISR